MRIASLLLLLAACGPRLDEERVGDLRMLTGTVDVGRDGQIDLKLQPQDGENAVLLTAQAESGARTHVLQVEQSKTIVFDAIDEATGVYATTNAGYLSLVSTLNWPRSERDELGPIRVTLGNVSSTDTYVRGELEITALFKSDRDLGAGTIEVAIVYAGGSEADGDLLNAVTGALDVWQSTYAATGVSVEVVAESTWPDGDLEAPVYGTEAAFSAIAEEVGPHVIPIVITPLISDIEDVLGVAGDIPGPLAATNRSAILVSSVTAAGPDGLFQDEDIRLLGETLAHETGHYLGLFHPVETTWDRWDALDDTRECKSEAPCIEQMRDLLMFPFPVCGFVGCTPQEVVTPEQSAVMHRYTGVD